MKVETQWLIDYYQKQLDNATNGYEIDYFRNILDKLRNGYEMVWVKKEKEKYIGIANIECPLCGKRATQKYYSKESFKDCFKGKWHDCKPTSLLGENTQCIIEDGKFVISKK